jgi:hypothetical protein
MNATVESRKFHRERVRLYECVARELSIHYIAAAARVS